MSMERGQRSWRFVFVTRLDLDGDVNQFLVCAEQRAVVLRRFRLVGSGALAE